MNPEDEPQLLTWYTPDREWSAFTNDQGELIVIVNGTFRRLYPFKPEDK
jgi:hypothetical protein